MADGKPGPPVRPRPVKTIGYLNILFGASLVAFAWTMLGAMAFNGLSAEPYEALGRAFELQADREHREVLDRLEELESSAQSEEARRLFREERQRREGRGPTIAPEAQLMMMGGQMQSFGTWSLVSSASSLALNLLLIASGVGLLQRVDWGRKLGIWVAAAKLARLAILQTIFVAAVVPPMSRQLGEAVGETISAQGGGMPPGMPNMTQMYMLMYTGWGVAVLVLGAIYPIVLLVMLTRPGVRAAYPPAAVRARAIMQQRRGAGRS